MGQKYFSGRKIWTSWIFYGDDERRFHLDRCF